MRNKISIKKHLFIFFLNIFVDGYCSYQQISINKYPSGNQGHSRKAVIFFSLPFSLRLKTRSMSWVCPRQPSNSRGPVVAVGCCQHPKFQVGEEPELWSFAMPKKMREYFVMSS